MVVILNESAGSVARNPSGTRSEVAALLGAAGMHPQIIVAQGKDVGAIVVTRSLLWRDSIKPGAPERLFSWRRAGSCSLLG